MSIEDARAALAGLESKLSDATARRDKVLQEISIANTKAERDLVNLAQSDRRPRGAARNSLIPLNKQAVAIDAEIGLLRIQITHARRDLTLQEAGKPKQVADANGGTGRLVQLEIRAPDGRVLRQWHRSVDAAQKALQHGYEVVGEVIGSGVVSPVGPGARSFMTSLLDVGGGELIAFLAAHGLRPVGIEEVKHD
jgi:hypothetical protein